MLATKEWFSRKFTLDLPVEQFPNILARLRGTPARLEELFRGVPPKVLINRDGDKWSMQEQAGHMLDLEPLGRDRLDDFDAGRPELHPADVKNRKTHEADHNARDRTEILAAFRAERMAFVARLENCDEAFLQRTALHPRLQMQMRIIDLGFFIAEHDDHHLARIAELRHIHKREIEEFQHAEGYRRMPQTVVEISEWESEQVWPE